MCGGGSMMYCNTVEDDGCDDHVYEVPSKVKQASRVSGSSMAWFALGTDCADQEHRCRILPTSRKQLSHHSRGKERRQIMVGLFEAGVQQATSTFRALGKLRKQRRVPGQAATAFTQGSGPTVHTKCRSTPLALARAVGPQLATTAGMQKSAAVSHTISCLKAGKRRSGGHATSAECVHEQSVRCAQYGQRSEGLGASDTLANGAASAHGRETLSKLVLGRVVAQPADGSCLFHSIAYGLNNGTTGDELRKQIVAFIRQYPLDKIADTTIEDWVKFATGQSIHSYAQRLRQPRTWGGALELALSAKLKQVNIHVYERNLQGGFRCITTFHLPEATFTVHIVYRTFPCKHYDALVIHRGEAKTLVPNSS